MSRSPTIVMPTRLPLLTRRSSFLPFPAPSDRSFGKPRPPPPNVASSCGLPCKIACGLLTAWRNVDGLINRLVSFAGVPPRRRDTSFLNIGAPKGSGRLRVTGLPVLTCSPISDPAAPRSWTTGRPLRDRPLPCPKAYKPQSCSSLGRFGRSGMREFLIKSLPCRLRSCAGLKKKGRIGFSQEQNI